MKRIIINGIIEENCYILSRNGYCYIMDPGDESKKIKEAIKEFIPLGILLTHAHADHIGAIHDFNLPIYVHKEDIILLKNPDLACYTMFKEKPKYVFSSLNIKPLEDNDIIKLDDEEIKVIYTPGHTNGSVCYLYKDKLFSGDTVFKGSLGRTDLPTGNNRKMENSFLKLFETIKKNVTIYPGHDETTSLNEEKKYNLFYLDLVKRGKHYEK